MTALGNARQNVKSGVNENWSELHGRATYSAKAPFIANYVDNQQIPNG